jgi:hypothetical protein
MATAAPGRDIPIEGKTLKSMALLMMKRTHHMFSQGIINEEDEDIAIRDTCAAL